MDVSQLFNMLRVTPDIEIVIAFLPEVFGVANQSSRHTLLQRLDCVRKHPALRLAEQQMDMIGHDYVAIHAHLELAAHSLQRPFKRALRRCILEEFSATIAAEGDKVSLSGFLKSLQPPRHTPSLGRNPSPLKPTPGLNGPPATSSDAIVYPRKVDPHLVLKTKAAALEFPAHIPRWPRLRPFKYVPSAVTFNSEDSERNTPLIEIVVGLRYLTSNTCSLSWRIKTDRSERLSRATLNAEESTS